MYSLKRLSPSFPFLRSFRALANELGVKMSLETIIFLGCNLRLTFSLGSQEMMYNGTRTRHFRAFRVRVILV